MIANQPIVIDNVRLISSTDILRAKNGQFSVLVSILVSTNMGG